MEITNKQELNTSVLWTLEIITLSYEKDKATKSYKTETLILE